MEKNFFMSYLKTKHNYAVVVLGKGNGLQTRGTCTTKTALFCPKKEYH